jgi:hypothetical protein
LAIVLRKTCKDGGARIGRRSHRGRIPAGIRSTTIDPIDDEALGSAIAVAKPECQLESTTTTRVAIEDETPGPAAASHRSRMPAGIANDDTPSDRRRSAQLDASIAFPFSFSRDSLIWLTADCIIRLSTLFLDVTCHLPKRLCKILDEFLIVS